MASININVPVFLGHNFNNWKFRLHSILEKEQLLCVVTEDPQIGLDEAKKKEYLKSDAKAKAIIIQGLSDKHLDIVKDCKTAKEMLKSLQDIFVRSSSFSKLTLWRKLINLKCDRNDRLEDHFLKFDSLARELEDHGSKIDESDKICHLLLSLPKEYETVITALETHDSLKMDLVRYRLLDEEAKLKSGKSSKTTTGNENEVSFKSYAGCFNCGDTQHFIANCPKRGLGQVHRSNPNALFDSGYRRGRSNSRNRHSRGSRFFNYNRRPSQIANAHTSSDVSFVALQIDSRPSLDLGEKHIFILDSGASSHLIKEELQDSMCDIETLQNNVVIAYT